MSDSQKITVLIIDNDQRLHRQVESILGKNYELLRVSSVNQIADIVTDIADVGAVIIRSFHSSGASAGITRDLERQYPDLPIVLFDAADGPLESTPEGPSPTKSRNEAVSRFVQSVRLAVESYDFANNPGKLIEYAENVYGMIGRSRPMCTVYELIRKMARTNSKAMILGETGTGKELVARAIHFTSRRKEMRFAILNCNHKSPELVESELFGHTRGSFTGAVSDRPGIFEYAHGGTIFLDEIGDLDLSTQAKLLRVLETGEYQKIGAEEMKHTEIRVLCATHKNLEKMVRDGSFRQDLFFRLKGVTILMPPLRERKEDIPLLVERSAAHYTDQQGLSPKYFSDDAIDIMVAFDWPGNVRQLIDTVESLIVLAESDVIAAEDVREYLNLQEQADAVDQIGLSARVKQFEKVQIINALRKTSGNISAAARFLKLDRTNLRRKMKSLDIDISRQAKTT